ncbi:hypothetical protein BDV93DRAFT_522630 [Ceratobasidium sp. AG-I]|nr:hypothetical protein BDV93DRAFT_522630 [Ceratobasidium sp. AG-I]
MTENVIGSQVFPSVFPYVNFSCGVVPSPRNHLFSANACLDIISNRQAACVCVPYCRGRISSLRSLESRTQPSAGVISLSEGRRVSDRSLVIDQGPRYAPHTSYSKLIFPATNGSMVYHNLYFNSRRPAWCTISELAVGVLVPTVSSASRMVAECLGLGSVLL